MKERYINFKNRIIDTALVSSAKIYYNLNQDYLLQTFDANGDMTFEFKLSARKKEDALKELENFRALLNESAG